MSDPQAITEYARIASLMKQARRNILAENGHDWGSFFKLESDVLSSLGDEPVETEFGTVSRRPRGKVQYRKLTEVEREYQITFKEPNEGETR